MVKDLSKLNSIDVSTLHIQNLYRTIGENVKRVRKEKGVSQLDLALAIGYKSVSSIAKAESLIEGKHFNIEQLFKIAKALEVPLDSFFVGIERL